MVVMRRRHRVRKVVLENLGHLSQRAQDKNQKKKKKK